MITCGPDGVPKRKRNAEGPSISRSKNIEETMSRLYGDSTQADRSLYYDHTQDLIKLEVNI